MILIISHNIKASLFTKIIKTNLNLNVKDKILQLLLPLHLHNHMFPQRKTYEKIYAFNHLLYAFLKLIKSNSSK